MDHPEYQRRIWDYVQDQSGNSSYGGSRNDDGSSVPGRSSTRYSASTVPDEHAVRKPVPTENLTPNLRSKRNRDYISVDEGCLLPTHRWPDPFPIYEGTDEPLLAHVGAGIVSTFDERLFQLTAAPEFMHAGGTVLSALRTLQESAVSYTSGSGSSLDLSVWSDWSEDLSSAQNVVFQPAIDKLVQTLIDEFAEWNARHARMSTNDASSSRNSTSRTTNTTCSQSGRDKGKRRQDTDGGSEEANGEDSSDRPRKRQIETGVEPSTKARLLACPFAKHDPCRYQRCYKYIMGTTSRLKQHLNRCHRIPLHCPVCSEIFNDEVDRDAHIRLRTCEPGPAPNWDGVTQAQRALLEKRVSSSKSIRENWYRIYAVLFPEDTPPSDPWIPDELDSRLSAMQDFLILHGSSIVRETVHTELASDEIAEVAQRAFETAIPQVLRLWVSEGFQVVPIQTTEAPDAARFQTRASSSIQSSGAFRFTGLMSSTSAPQSGQGPPSDSPPDSDFPGEGQSTRATRTDFTFRAPAIPDSLGLMHGIAPYQLPLSGQSHVSTAFQIEQPQIVTSDAPLGPLDLNELPGWENYFNDGY